MKHQHLKVNFNLTAIQQRAALCPEKAALSNVTAFSTSLLCIASWDGAVLLIDVTLKDFWVSKFKMFILLSLADIWSGKLAEYPGSALI